MGSPRASLARSGLRLRRRPRGPGAPRPPVHRLSAARGGAAEGNAWGGRAPGVSQVFLLPRSSQLEERSEASASDRLAPVHLGSPYRARRENAPPLGFQLQSKFGVFAEPLARLVNARLRRVPCAWLRVLEGVPAPQYRHSARELRCRLAGLCCASCGRGSMFSNDLTSVLIVALSHRTFLPQWTYFILLLLSRVVPSHMWLAFHLWLVRLKTQRLGFI